jgi:phosphosulfolactate synthase
MNFPLKHIPERTSPPRKNGLTMVMDKGVGLKQAEAFVDSCGPYVDLVKLGFGTSYLTPNLEEKIKLYQKAGIRVFLGGTLFEVFLVRGQFKDYQKLLGKLGLDTCEVSDGSINIPHKKKCEYIETLAKEFTVLSEVGSKEEGIIIHPAKWISMMTAELNAGTWRLIAEAREGGNVGIFHRSGATHTLLINKITAKVKTEKIIWETPLKNKQVWFVKHFGANVNLGNIGLDDVIPLECLRLGLRGDTFHTFLPENLKNQ